MPFIDSQGRDVEPPEFITIEIQEFDQAGDLSRPALALPFETGVDGRAFSAAALFRAEGYSGQLIGTGEVGLDRVAYGFRVGFDLLWVTEDEFGLLSDQHLSPFPSHYQFAVGRSL